VSDLAGCELIADEQFTADDDAGTDTATYPDEHEVVAVGNAGDPVLGEHRRIGVIGDVARHVERGGDLARQRFVRPFHMCCREHHAAVVDDARRGDAHAEKWPLERTGQLSRQPHHRSGGLRAGLAVAGE
jgi:hypothetical protein